MTIHHSPIILFDGVCNYCNAMVNFLIRHDKKKIFLFAALQSRAGQELLKKHGLLQNSFDSFILIEDGKTWQHSTAALKITKYLPWYLRFSEVFWIFPKFIRDTAYSFIARNRYRWFGRKESCMIPGDDVRSRFLP